MSTVPEIKDYATFIADVPDDMVVEEGLLPEDDKVVQPGGAAVAELLRAAVANRGLTTSAIYQHSHYGWAFDVSVGRDTVWCMIQFPDPWLLITEVRRTFPGWLFRRRAGDEMHKTVLSILQETLAVAPFRSASWMTRTEYEA